MDYRQLVVDAAVVELRSQLGVEDVQQDGTHVQAEGSFKMARVIEAALRVALTTDNDPLIAVIVKALKAERGSPGQIRDEAADVLYDIVGAVQARLDPLP